MMRSSILLVLFSVLSISAFASEQEAVLKQPSKDECIELEAKAAREDALSPEEGDKYIRCFIPPSSNGWEGFQANQPTERNNGATPWLYREEVNS